ncbi:unnamed protein product [Macrosiphum euphorbiae]|uniref:Transposase domain-containing protein n=1 Tax=Macrosiphum euphorbiae TaxID=13131 RepID=A0AAV0XTF9_9HEMI|nr:unnamed protein product [Macrosiphum euphorbiae]
MPFCQKNFNLSVRSKRRRVTEELKNNVPINLVDPVLSTSSTSENVTTTSHFNSNLDNIFFLPSNQPTQNSSNQLNASHSRHDLNDSQIIPNNLNIHRSEKHDNSHLIDENIDFEPSDPSQTLSDDIKCLIRKWTIEFNIPQIALNKLLRILKRHKCFDSFPLDSRTLMQNNNKHLGISKLKIIEPGSYYHFGIENGIKLNMVDNVRNVSVIEIAVGIDGLPLYKSSSDQFWPILAYIRPNGHVFPIGIYHGKYKPSDSNKFILDFIEEAKLLMQNGVRINGKMYDFHVSVLCCDAPAKSYVLRTKGHSGFSSCSRCEHEGEYIQNRVCFPYLKPERCPPKRTHQNYITRLNEDHHIINNSIIATLPNFDVVYGFSMDYLHLVCLGTVRKLINLWIKGPMKVRYPSWKINKYQSNNSQTNFNITSELIEFQSASIDNIVVVADNTDDSHNVEGTVNNIIRTTASPFKVTNVNDTTTTEITEPYIPLSLTPAGSQSFTSDSLIDKVNKINRTTLNTWYEIKSMNEKIEKLETNLFITS